MTRTAAHRLPSVSGLEPDLPRLLVAGPDLATHLARVGPLPAADGLLAAAADAGLVGRGGAAFPTARKLAAAANQRGRRVVVASGTEGEPLSHKDKALLLRAPHLVLDGLTLAAAAVGAERRILAVEAGRPDVEASVRSALAERGDGITEVVLTPRRYLSGQETALVDLIDGGSGRPSLPRPFERGVGGQPTAVDNVETLAHLALIGRFGPGWYRRVGTSEDPGSTLVTVAGAVSRPGVYEVAHGHPLAELIAGAGARTHAVRAVLVGGYYGRWLAASALPAARLDRRSLAPLGASPGCGVIAVIDESSCAVDEIARVAEWFAANSAGQCGACTWGLRDLAGAAASVNAGAPEPSATADVRRWAAMVRGRGACRLPDGAAGFLESAFDVFGDEIADHVAGRCSRRRAGLLPTPSPEPW